MKKEIFRLYLQTDNSEMERLSRIVRRYFDDYVELTIEKVNYEDEVSLRMYVHNLSTQKCKIAEALVWGNYFGWRKETFNGQ